MKKLLLCLMALCCSAAMWGFASNTVEWSDDARDNVKVDAVTGLSYYLDEEENAIITYQSDDESNYADWTTLTIPETVDGYTVTTIGKWAFYHAGFEGKLVIPGYLLHTSECSFAYCEKLETVEFEYSETPLADLNTVAYNSAFIGCDNVKTIVCDRDITVTTSSAVVAPFSYVQGIETVYIGENVTTIPHYAFRSNYAATLKYVISDAATPPALGTTPFANANSELTFYTQAEYLNAYKAVSSWVDSFKYTAYDDEDEEYTVSGKKRMHAYDGDDPEEPVDELAFLSDGLWFKPNYDDAGDEDGTCSIIAAQGGDEYTGVISIPATATNSETGAEYSVTRIGESAFSGATIKGELLIPCTIYNMGAKAFADCSRLTTVTYEYCATPLYEENTETTDQSFSGCTKVTDVYLNRDITLANTNGLVAPFCYMSSVQRVFIGNMVTYIPTYMFRNTTNYPSLVDVVCYAAEPPAIGLSPFGAKSPANYDPDPILWVWDEYWEIYLESDLYQSGGDWTELGAIEDSRDYWDMDYPFNDYPEGWEGKGDTEDTEEGEESGDIDEGITSIDIDASAKTKGIYNLAGQRVSAATKGLLIVDGKKVIVK